MTAKTTSLRQMTDEADLWNQERLQAYIWWCGDDQCNCQQAQIRGVKPNHEAGYPWIKPVTIWTGTFFTDGEGGEIPTEELLDEVNTMKKLGIEIEVSL